MTSNQPAPFALSPEQFYDRFDDIIANEVWPALGLQWTSLLQAAADCNDMLSADHGAVNVSLSDDARATLRANNRSMGFFDARDLVSGHFKELHTTGLKYGGMERGFGHILGQIDLPGVTVERIVYKTGQRPFRKEWDGAAYDKFFDMLFNTDHPLAELLKRLGLPTEFELALLAIFVATDGNVELVSEEAADRSLELSGTRKRSRASVTLRLPNKTEILVINSPAIERPKGDPAPTATSMTEHYLKYYFQTNNPGGAIALRNGKTHWRVSYDMMEVLEKYDPTLTFAACWEATTDEEAANGLDLNALGELFRLIIKAALASSTTRSDRAPR